MSAATAGDSPARRNHSTEPLLRVKDVSLNYRVRRSLAERVRRAPRLRIRAVRGVTLEVAEGETVGLVGESGCGKSSLARCIAGLVPPSGGEMWFRGDHLSASRGGSSARQIQMVFQDPASSLNPSITVGGVLEELLRFHRVVPRNKLESRSRELVQMVGLPVEVLHVYPRRLSGGQRQRVALARALALEPKLLIADEPTSALDVSVQAAVLNLLARLRDELNLTMLFISHNLAVVRRLCNRVAIMYAGKIVEEGPASTIMASPRHPYTAALLSAIPQIDLRDRRSRLHLAAGEAPSPVAIPSGCAFHPRCPNAQDLCTSSDPPLTPEHVSAPNQFACHFPMMPTSGV
jgi:oligopeptide transport system ATP-binding protein